jgi:hypothetical protein
MLKINFKSSLSFKDHGLKKLKKKENRKMKEFREKDGYLSIKQIKQTIFLLISSN